VIKIRKDTSVPVVCASLLLIAALPNNSQANVFSQLANVAANALPVYGQGQHPHDIEPDQASQAIKQVLSIASERVIDRVQRERGYHGDSPKLLADLRTARKMAAEIGYKEKFDKFEQQLDHAVVVAAPMLAELFDKAVEGLEIDQPHLVLFGDDTAATEYVRKQLASKLRREMQPLVDDALSYTGATETCNDLAENIRFGKLLNTLMAEQVMNKSLASFFRSVEDEERAIRQDPTSQDSEILRRALG